MLSRCRISGSEVRAIRVSTGCYETQGRRGRDSWPWRLGRLMMGLAQNLPALLQAQPAQVFCTITWYTDISILKFQISNLVFPLIDTVHSDVYSPVYFFFQLMPARMKLTSDPSCPKVNKIPRNKWISLDKTKSRLTFCTLAKST